MDTRLERVIQESRKVANQLARILERENRKIVFAESCTAGLVSALLAETPGISEWHCGSAVVYQVETKEQWLGIEPEILEDPGPVSEIVARKMAEAVLKKTKQANISASVTGHLGPGAPEGLDGKAFVGICLKEKGEVKTDVAPIRLMYNDDSSVPFESEKDLRLFRQYQAAMMLLSLVVQKFEKVDS